MLWSRVILLELDFESCKSVEVRHKIEKRALDQRGGVVKIRTRGGMMYDVYA